MNRVDDCLILFAEQLIRERPDINEKQLEQLRYRVGSLLS
jgi:hypothetical protein